MQENSKAITLLEIGETGTGRKDFQVGKTEAQVD